MSHWRVEVKRPEGGKNSVKFIVIASEDYHYFSEADARRDVLYPLHPDCRITVRPLSAGWINEIIAINKRGQFTFRQ